MSQFQLGTREFCEDEAVAKLERISLIGKVKLCNNMSGKITKFIILVWLVLSLSF